MPDAWYHDVGLAWEIDSYEWHLAPADYALTLDRRSAMMAEGIVVMHTLPSKLTRREPEVLAELRVPTRRPGCVPARRSWRSPRREARTSRSANAGCANGTLGR